MIKNPYHLALIRLFRQHQNILDNNDWVKKYLGTDKYLYQIKTAPKVIFVKSYLKSINLSYDDFCHLLMSLSRGNSFEEIGTMGILLNTFSKYRHQLSLSVVDLLFDHTVGWAEIDITCCFTAEDLLANWPDWQKLLSGFAKDKNIAKRRASLVLFTLPFRTSDDLRLRDLAINNINLLKSEKDILITKAISWVLRSMITYHSQFVSKFIDQNRDSLPSIAYRETYRKLTTGRKNPTTTHQRR